MKNIHPGAKWLFRVRSYFSLLFLGIMISIWGSSILVNLFTNFNISSIILTWIIIVIILILVIGEVYARLSYRFWLYEFTDSQLRLERGIIWKKYSNIPYERVQNVDIQRGIIARLCGFSTVNIQTAGYSAPVGRSYGSGAEGFIPAVSSVEAEKIREFIMKKISKKGRSQGL
jgi:membrane protein YdbS with pleckstrin-like domain